MDSSVLCMHTLYMISKDQTFVCFFVKTLRFKMLLDSPLSLVLMVVIVRVVDCV